MATEDVIDSRQKSLWVAYVLWLFGGWFGLHHLYLGRDRHAFVSWMSFGSYFGLGWIRELWRLPEYVRESNQDDQYLAEQQVKCNQWPKPPSSMVRLSGTIIVADILGYLVIGAIPVELLPDKTLPILCAILAPLATAIGVHLVGNIGSHEGPFRWPLLGAYLTAPLYFISTSSVFWSSLLAAWFFNRYSKAWRQPRLKRHPRPGLMKRAAVLFLCCTIYLALWSSWIYFNCSLKDEHDQEIKCRDAAKNFFNSPVWLDFTRTLQDLWNYIKHHGWSGVWKEIVSAFDPAGEANAIKVLNLASNATQEEITARYKLLARQWHPDRHKSPEAKREAQERFIHIQQAYEVLSRIKNQRLRRNKKERDNPDERFTSNLATEQPPHEQTRQESNSKQEL